MTGSWGALALWAGAALVVAVTAVSFVLWGLNGPAYLVDSDRSLLPLTPSRFSLHAPLPR